MTEIKRKEPDQYLTYAEVARRWKCSKATVRRRVADGQLEVFGSSTLTRITRESVIAYEAAGRRRRAS